MKLCICQMLIIKLKWIIKLTNRRWCPNPRRHPNRPTCEARWTCWCDDSYSIWSSLSLVRRRAERHGPPRALCWASSQGSIAWHWPVWCRCRTLWRTSLLISCSLFCVCCCSTTQSPSPRSADFCDRFRASIKSPTSQSKLEQKTPIRWHKISSLFCHSLSI